MNNIYMLYLKKWNEKNVCCTTTNFKNIIKAIRISLEEYEMRFDDNYGSEAVNRFDRWVKSAIIDETNPTEHDIEVLNYLLSNGDISIYHDGEIRKVS